MVIHQAVGRAFPRLVSWYTTLGYTIHNGRAIDRNPGRTPM